MAPGRPAPARGQRNQPRRAGLHLRSTSTRSRWGVLHQEDITEYITKTRCCPSCSTSSELLSRCRECPAGSGRQPYIHDAVKHGVDLPQPPNIAAGLEDVSQRGDWNRRADGDYALPTETWREHIARRKRYQQILDDFAAGKITTINDFITYNLDIIKFTHDFLSDTQDPMVIRAFYFECLRTVTVLDPTCGSGAALFAALNILEPLYELCLQRMEDFIARKQRHPQWAQLLEAELKRLADHPSRRYFIYKSIIVGNLYGVDIMEEAVEICKLRLFLKLVAQVEDVVDVEPLPDIDFNIRAGNTLVGYATLEEIERAKTQTMDFSGTHQAESAQRCPACWTSSARRNSNRQQRPAARRCQEPFESNSRHLEN